MLRIAFIVAFLWLATIPAAQAGFEWLPPEKNPVEKPPNAFDIPVMPPMVKDKLITPSYQAPMQYKTPTPMTASSFMKHKPTTTHMARPMNSEISHFSNTSRPAMAHQNRPTLSNVQNRPVSLFIDPYPMGRESVNVPAREMQTASIEQAMMESENRATPLNIGGGMQTGAQMAYAQNPTVPMPTNNPVSGMTPSSLTPVGAMGGIQSAPMNATTIRNYAKIEGFGSDLPLALALNQVIPSDFVHSFALGVDPGTTVSWQGGKPWNTVLDEMLRPQGLTATIKQNMVTVQPIMAL